MHITTRWYHGGHTQAAFLEDGLDVYICFELPAEETAVNPMKERLSRVQAMATSGDNASKDANRRPVKPSSGCMQTESCGHGEAKTVHN